MTLTTDTAHPLDAYLELDDLPARQAAAQMASAAAREKLAAAREALGDAQVTGDATGAHRDAAAAAREALEDATTYEAALERRRRELTPEEPQPVTVPVISAAAEGQRLTVRALGKPGRPACYTASGRQLVGGDRIELDGREAVWLVHIGAVTVDGRLPKWWPRAVPILDE